MPSPNDALQYARDRSQAAYDSAASNPVVQFIRNVKTPHVRRRVEEVFSREMLGSVLVGATVARMMEVSVSVIYGAVPAWRILTWVGFFTASVALFVYWDHVAKKASKAADEATDKASEAAEKATEAADQATDTAKEATEKATEAADQATDTAKEATEKAKDATGAETDVAGAAGDDPQSDPADPADT